MNIHKYLKERGFEMTGEFERVRQNEYYLDHNACILRWKEDHQTAGMYVILKKLRQTFEFDGQTFEVPEGYVFERVGLVRKSDVGKYTLGGPGAIYQEITEKNLSWRDCIYVILRKEN